MSTEEIKAILCKSTALHMSEEDIVAILCNGLFPSQEGDEAKSTALDMSAEDIVALLCNSPLKEEDNAKELMESSVESCESTELATSDEEIVATLSDSPLSSREGDSGGELMVSFNAAVFDDDYDAEDDGVAFALEEFAFADAGKEDEEDKRPMKRPRVGEPEASSLLDLISPLEEGGDVRDSMPSDVKVVIEDYDDVDDENDDDDAEDDAEDDNDDDSTPEGVSLAKCLAEELSKYPDFDPVYF